MGKFSGLVLCSDIDGTLIDDWHNIPQNNLEAIAYFREQGGLVTIATGRTPDGARKQIELLQPDLPIICQNGCGIYDWANNRYLWTMGLDDGVTEPVEYVMRHFPFAGVEIICEHEIYVIRENEATLRHRRLEDMTGIFAKLQDVPKPWLKVLFAQEEQQADLLTAEMRKTNFGEKYCCVRTHAYYYEFFNKQASKGVALKKLSELMHLATNRFIAVGDNDNDFEMMRVSGRSAAPQNACEKVKAIADFVTVSNNDGAIADLIKRL